MAFTPTAGKFYFLVAKHSNMPLGIHGRPNLRGAVLEQQAFNLETPQPQQHFYFESSDDQHVYIKLRNFDLYLEPLGSRDGQGRADGTPIVLENWNATHENQRFQFIPAGDGYYHIRCRHTGSFLDVYGNTDQVGAQATQHRYMGSDNQLFRPVMVVGQGIGADPTSFQAANENLRNAIVNISGAIPEVGTGLKFLVGGLWPAKDKQQQVWEQMKEYVDQRVKALLHEQEMKDLRLMLEGTLERVKKLADAPDTVSQPKGTEVDAIVGNIIEKHRKFLGDHTEYGTDDKVNPQQILPYLVGMGTILLSLMRQQAANYRQLYLPLAPDLEAGKSAETKEREAKESDLRTKAYEKDLRYMLLRYTRAAASARTRALAWRLGFIKDVVTTPHHTSGALTETSTARDDYDGWQMEWSFTDRVHRKSTGDRDHRARADHAHAARLQQVEAQFGAELDALLNPVRLWQYYDQQNTKPAQPVSNSLTVGPFGGNTNSTAFDAPAGHGRLSGIILYQHENIAPLAGMELFYGGVSAGLVGKRTSKKAELTLAEDEYVTSVHGKQYNVLEAVVFQTNKGREVRNGDGGLGWSGDVDDSLNARLTKVSGKAGAEMIDSITLHWNYDYPAAPLPALKDLPSLHTLLQQGTELQALRQSLPPQAVFAE